jgi:hypothetical protein
MAPRKIYQQAIGKTVKEIDSLEQEGETFIAIKFSDEAELTFSIRPRPMVVQMHGAVKNRRK